MLPLLLSLTLSILASASEGNSGAETLPREPEVTQEAAREVPEPTVGSTPAIESSSATIPASAEMTTQDLPAAVLEWYRNHLESQITESDRIRVEKTQDPGGEARYHLVREQEDSIQVYSFDIDGDLKHLSRR